MNNKCAVHDKLTVFHSLLVQDRKTEAIRLFQKVVVNLNKNFDCFAFALAPGNIRQIMRF